MADYMYWILSGVAVVGCVIAAWLQVRNTGYKKGYDEGRAAGRTEGMDEWMEDGRKEGYAQGHADGLEQGRIEGQVEERARQAREKERKNRSPWARDWPESTTLEVAHVPYNTVTLCSSVMVDMLTADRETKLEIQNRLNAELLKEAREYIEIDWYDDPTTNGRTFRGRLRVLRRRDDPGLHTCEQVMRSL